MKPTTLEGPEDQGASTRAKRRSAAIDKSARGPRPAEKKKAQNRVAQKSFREKQQAYVQYLESYVKAIKSSREVEDDDDRYNQLLRSHLKLLEDYHQLQESFIRLRQKLWAIGQSATDAADDEDIDKMLKAHEVTQTRSILDGGHLPQAASRAESASRGRLALEDSPRVSRLPTEPLSLPSTSQPQLTSGGNMSTYSGEMSIAASSSGVTLASPSFALPRDLSPSILFLAGPQSLGFSPSPGIGNRFTDSLALVQSKTIFATKVEAACRRCINAINIGDGSLTAYGKHTPEQIITKLASTAVNLMGDLSGMLSFIYGSEMCKCLVSIIRWRICRDVESRAAIKGILHPTPLQYTSMDHPIIIDFITWPSVRDQMILRKDELDLDTLASDLTLHAVVEIPEKGISIGVYDFIANSSVSSWQIIDTPSSTCVDSPSWTYIHLSPESPYMTSDDPAEDLLMQELTSRLQGISFNAVTEPTFAPIPGSSQNHRTVPVGIESLQAKVNNMSNWRLNRAFTRKWPMIDCTGLLSSYDTVPYRLTEQYY